MCIIIIYVIICCYICFTHHRIVYSFIEVSKVENKYYKRYFYKIHVNNAQIKLE